MLSYTFDIFYIRNFLGLLTASILDSAIMGSVLSTKLPFERVISIFVKDVGFKFAYSITTSLLVLAVIYVIEQVREKKI